MHVDGCSSTGIYNIIILYFDALHSLSAFCLNISLPVHTHIFSHHVSFHRVWICHSYPFIICRISNINNFGFMMQIFKGVRKNLIITASNFPVSFGQMIGECWCWQHWVLNKSTRLRTAISYKRCWTVITNVGSLSQFAGCLRLIGTKGGSTTTSSAETNTDTTATSSAKTDGCWT